MSTPNHITNKISRIQKGQEILKELNQIENALGCLRKQAKELVASDGDSEWGITLSMKLRNPPPPDKPVNVFDEYGFIKKDYLPDAVSEGEEQVVSSRAVGVWAIKFPEGLLGSVGSEDSEKAQADETGKYKHPVHVTLALHMITLIIKAHEARKKQLLKRISKL